MTKEQVFLLKEEWNKMDVENHIKQIQNLIIEVFEYVTNIPTNYQQGLFLLQKVICYENKINIVKHKYISNYDLYQLLFSFLDALEEQHDILYVLLLGEFMSQNNKNIITKKFQHFISNACFYSDKDVKSFYETLTFVRKPTKPTYSVKKTKNDF